MRFWLLGLLLALGVGCKSRHSASAGDALSALRMEYAGRIRIDSSEHYILVRVQNPWDTARILHTYVLVDRETELPVGLPEGTLVRTPVEKALVYSSVHCGLLSELGAIDRTGGICDLQYIEIPEIQNRCASGRMVDAGNSMNPDIEKIIDFHPDAILLSPFENSGGYGYRLSNVPIIWRPLLWGGLNGCVFSVCFSGNGGRLIRYSLLSVRIIYSCVIWSSL